MTASHVLLYRTLASAQEALPEPVSVTVDHSYGKVLVHLREEGDRDRWQEWLARHDAKQWRTLREDVEGYRHDVVSTTWSAWRIDLVYLSPVESKVGAR